VRKFPYDLPALPGAEGPTAGTWSSSSSRRSRRSTTSSGSSACPTRPADRLRRHPDAPARLGPALSHGAEAAEAPAGDADARLR
jgi:hypothetical protein